MELNLRNIGIMLLIGAIGALCGYYVAPTKVKIEEKVVTRVVKDTVTRIVERPDGTKETVIKEKDRTETDKEKKTEKSKPEDQWIFTALVEASSIDNAIFNAQRRILGPAYVGVWVSTKGAFGLSVGLRF